MLAEPDRSTLLSLVSALHRRAVEVTRAELDADGNGHPQFTATFLGTPSQAGTVAASLENLVDVLEARLEAPLDLVAASR